MGVSLAEDYTADPSVADATAPPNPIKTILNEGLEELSNGK